MPIRLANLLVTCSTVPRESAVPTTPAAISNLRRDGQPISGLPIRRSSGRSTRGLPPHAAMPDCRNISYDRGSVPCMPARYAGSGASHACGLSLGPSIAALLQEYPRPVPRIAARQATAQRVNVGMVRRSASGVAHSYRLLNTFPAFASVNRPPSTMAIPFTNTYGIPTAYWCGAVKVAGLPTLAASKSVMSAKQPTARHPR